MTRYLLTALPLLLALESAAAGTQTCSKAAVPSATGCEESLSNNQDFTKKTPMTVNDDALFGFDDWEFSSKDESPGNSGEMDITCADGEQAMMVFKSGKGTTITGCLVSGSTVSYGNPFKKDISHISVYCRPGGSGPDPVAEEPEPVVEEPEPVVEESEPVEPEPVDDGSTTRTASDAIPNAGCEASPTENQDFLNKSPMTVNAEALLGYDDWEFSSKNEGPGNSGTMENTCEDNQQAMMVFKSGKGTTITGCLVSGSSISYGNPFEKDISHISVYCRPGGPGGPEPVVEEPEPVVEEPEPVVEEPEPVVEEPEPVEEEPEPVVEEPEPVDDSSTTRTASDAIPNAGCEASLTENQDFLNKSPMTVNAEALLGYDDWEFSSKNEGPGNSGTMENTCEESEQAMMVFKSGKGTTITGCLVSGSKISYGNPFEKDISHISVYCRPGDGEEEVVEPEPVEPEPVVEEPEPVEDETFTKSSVPGTKGDPHFKTHGGEMYDFHGGCDMVLLDNPNFMEGLGMRVHIRTKIATWWSYVESAAIQIGDQTIEIQGGSRDQWLFLNGKAPEAIEESKFTLIKLAGLTVRYRQHGGNGEVHLHYARGEKMVMKTYKDFVKVEVLAEGSKYFDGSLGLLGRFPDGQRVGRDGNTFIEDINTFGQEWQVLGSEPKLFHTYDADWIVPAGQKCAMPVETLEKSQLRQRRLNGGIDMAVAEKACSRVTDVTEHKACVFDVIATQDTNMGAVW